MITPTVNGTRRTFDGDLTMPLPWFRRDELQLVGTTFGCGLAMEQVTVHVTLLGGGARRKSTPDFIREAAWLARAIGAPVEGQLTGWTDTDGDG
jgi:hypothetical protein